MGARHPHRRFGVAALVLALAGFTLVACGDDDDSTADTGDDVTGDEVTVADLDGREFVSEQVEGWELVPGSVIRITFEADTLGIDAGCNNMGGSYTLADGVLVAEQLASTEMACEEPLMEQDSWVAGLVTEGAEISLGGDALVLAGESGTITAVDREVAEPDLALEGTEWIVDGIVSGDTVGSTIAGAEATMLIEDGTVSVDTGCNTASGEVEAGPDTLTFGPMATTMRACEPDVMEQEAAILAVLQGEVDYVIDSDHLSITDADRGIDFRAER